MVRIYSRDLFSRFELGPLGTGGLQPINRPPARCTASCSRQTQSPAGTQSTRSQRPCRRSSCGSGWPGWRTCRWTCVRKTAVRPPSRPASCRLSSQRATYPQVPGWRPDRRNGATWLHRTRRRAARCCRSRCRRSVGRRTVRRRGGYRRWQYPRS